MAYLSQCTRIVILVSSVARFTPIESTSNNMPFDITSECLSYLLKKENSDEVSLLQAPSFHSTSNRASCRRRVRKAQKQVQEVPQGVQYRRVVRRGN